MLLNVNVYSLFVKSVKVFALSTLFFSTVNFADNSQQPQSLANNLEQVKSAVLKLNRELFILEEDLLFPASTQVAVFVSVDIGRFFALDSVELKIDSKDVSGFLYTDRQRKALEKGGIQRIYLGNLKTGKHQLTAIFTGVDNDGRTIKQAVTHQFNKDDDAKMIELKVEDNVANYRAAIHVEEWAL